MKKIVLGQIAQAIGFPEYVRVRICNMLQSEEKNILLIPIDTKRFAFYFQELNVTS